MPVVPMPHGYGGFSSFQFNSPDRLMNQYYNGGYPGGAPPFAPPYSGQPSYQKTVNRINDVLLPGFSQYPPPSFKNTFTGLVVELAQQYQHARYLRELEKLRSAPYPAQPYAPQYYPPQPYSPPLYGMTEPLLGPLSTYGPEIVYQYIKETKYRPFPIPESFGPRNYGFGFNPNFGIGGSMALPPKIKVIFVPTGQSCLQQPCMGPLTMPSFLYNRMSQPFCSFPLPPPLPQIGSLPLTPSVQQMVTQRYSNPIAVLPFNANWQMSSWMMSSYSQMNQQQCQPTAIMPSFQSYPFAPQTCIPSSVPAFPSFPNAPQSCFPFSALMPPAFPSFPSFPSAPQSFALPPPPSAIIPPNLPILTPPMPEYNGFSSFPQYTNIGYPSMCRACPPAPPPLSVPVTGYCWIQHCAACHNIPTPISNPNIRPVGGRITPLLRQPVVSQCVPDQPKPKHRRHHSHRSHNSTPVMRPWLIKTPPLPPGAVIISDEFIDENGSHSFSEHLKSQELEYQHSASDKTRSTNITHTKTSSTSSRHKKNSRNASPRQINNNYINPLQQQEFIKSKNTKSPMSLNSLTGDSSVIYQNVTTLPANPKTNGIPSQLLNEARPVSIRYNYPSQDITSVYLLNRYLQSSSEASTTSSSCEKLSDCSPSPIKEYNQISLSSSLSSCDLPTIKEESNSEKDNEKILSHPFQEKKPREKLVIIREFRTNSPSTLSTVSSNSEFSIID